LGGGEDLSGRLVLAGDPERFKVRDCTAGGEVAQGLIVPDHRSQGLYTFKFKGRSGSTAVKGMVVWIDETRHPMRRLGQMVRRFDHLTGIFWRGIGLVVLQLLRQGVQDFLIPGIQV